MKPKQIRSEQYDFSNTLNHECGLAMVRLFKPLIYYKEKYHDSGWGIHKLRLLMEKQRNRGQDSVGFSVLQFNMPHGQPFIERCRSAKKNAIEDLFATIDTKLQQAIQTTPKDADDLTIKKHSRILGEVYLGHLRYATHGGNNIIFSQPYLLYHTIAAKILMFTGNFNMTNTAEIMQRIIEYGLSPASSADGHIISNQVHYWLGKEYCQAKTLARAQGLKLGQAVQFASKNINIAAAITQAARYWDGGYVFAGIVGNGDAFICRDPAGIRSGFYYKDDELFAAASERSALMNALDVPPEQITKIPPAGLFVIKKDGTIEKHQFTQPLPKTECVFERIYFSRPSDPDIYQERKALGVDLANRLYKELNYNINNTIFSFIPNTSEISFRGLIEQLNELIFNRGYQQLIQNGTEYLSQEEIIKLTHTKARVEKLIFKDQVIRTFIANDTIRSDLVSKVYDVTRGVVTKQDTLIAIDDSIVRGTTLRQSIIRQLITLKPKKIIIVSAAPIIMYPDCYGVDMSQIGGLIGFQAAITLAKEQNKQAFIDELYAECTELLKQSSIKMYNPIQKLYAQFSQKELETKIADLVYPHNSDWKNEIQIMYQTIEGMHKAIPNYTGDWYFTGNYPTPGGYKVVMQSFVNWYKQKTGRAY